MVAGAAGVIGVGAITVPIDSGDKTTGMPMLPKTSGSISIGAITGIGGFGVSATFELVTTELGI